MKKIFLFLLIAFLQRASVSQTGWITQSSGTEDSLRCVKFINSQTGWTVGTNGIILRTSNSGINWNKIDAGIGNDFNSVFLISSSSLYIAGENGALISTDNGGVLWNYLFSNTTVDLNSVYFIDSQTGWAAGDSGIIIKTSNAGFNWMFLNSGTNIKLKSVHFANSHDGWVAGYGGIFYSSNGGNNWMPQFIDGNLNLNSIFFTDSLNGWAGYYDNKTFGPQIVRTTDGGIGWENYSMNNSYTLAVFFINSNKGWSPGFYGKINYSTDGGVSWEIQSSGTIEHLNSVYFTDSLTGWIVGNAGSILKTTTGGILTGFSNLNLVSVSSFSLEQNYPNPFNPVTNLEFGISELGFVSLKIFDILGKEIKTIVNSTLLPGKYKYVYDASGLTNGIYFYTLKLNGFSQTKVMSIVK